MEGMQLRIYFRCFIVLAMAGLTSGQSCEPCINFGPLNTADNDPSLVGTYRKLESFLDCPEGCGYLKDGDANNDTWCLKDGPYIPQYACPSPTAALPTNPNAASSSQPDTTVAGQTGTEAIEEAGSTQTGTIGGEGSTKIGTTGGAGSIPAVTSGGAGSTPAVTTGGAESTPAVTTGGAGSTPAVTTGGAESTPAVTTAGAGSSQAGTTGGAGSTPTVTTGGAGSTPAVTTGGAGSTPAVTTGGAGSTPVVTTGGAGSTPAVTTGGAESTPAVTTAGAGSSQAGTTEGAGTQKSSITGGAGTTQSGATEAKTNLPGTAGTSGTIGTGTTQSGTTSSDTCESGWSLFDKRCYKLSTEATEWATAKYLCECGGAELVSIASQGEDDFIVSLIGSEESWTGLNDLATQETYLWTDDTTFSYNNWNTNQPNNAGGTQDCVKIRTDGKWDDVTCGKSIKYVCEKGDSSVTKKPVTCTTPAPSTSVPTLITTQSTNCDSGWSHHQGKCYKLMTDKLSWDAARTSCVCTQSAELASLTTAAEQAFAKNLISENTWIGATDVETENTFIWSDGTIYTTADYSAFWSSGQPNNAGDTSNQDCVSMKTDGLWDDVSCATTRQFICEKPDKTATALTANPACSCASGWSGSIHTKKCYKKFTTPLASFDLSRTACQDESADLASIGSVTEQTFVWSTILENSSPNCWIGGEDKTTDGTFVWTDGTSLTYTNWATLNNIQQPAGGTVQNCLQMRFADGFWDDAKCDKDTNVYICKK